LSSANYEAEVVQNLHVKYILALCRIQNLLKTRYFFCLLAFFLCSYNWSCSDMPSNSANA